MTGAEDVSTRNLTGQLAPNLATWSSDVSGAIVATLDDTGNLAVAGLTVAGVPVAPPASQVLASPAASITFSAIPQTYSLLRLIVTGASASATESDRWLVQINGDAGAHYDIQVASANDTTLAGIPRIAFAAWQIATANPPGDMPGASATAGLAGMLEIEIPAYAGTTLQKVANWRSGYSDAATSAADQITISGIASWRSTAAITSILIGTATASNLVTGTAAYLYLY
jgi:hypothetical protein